MSRNSDNRTHTALPTGDLSCRLQPSGARFSHTSSKSLKPGIPLAASVASGPAQIALTRILYRPRSRARYRVTDSSAALETRIQSYCRHACDELTESRVTSEPPCSFIKGRKPAASSLNENALTCSAVATLSHGVLRKFPPSASAGANATECTIPSSESQRSPIA